MDNFGVQFGLLVRTKRGIEGLTQQQLASVAFGDESFKTRISELENGKIANPQQKTVDRLVVALEITNEELTACRIPLQRQNAEQGQEHSVLDQTRGPEQTNEAKNDGVADAVQKELVRPTSVIDPTVEAAEINANDAVSSGANSTRFKWLKRGALGLVVIVAAIVSAGMLSPNPDSPYWSKGRPAVFMSTDDKMTEKSPVLEVILDAVKAELGHGFSTKSHENRQQSDIGVYAFQNWAVLNETEGLRERCGDECVPGGSMSLSRVYQYSDNVFNRKDIFINLSRFVQADANRGPLRFGDGNLQCLAKVIAREIRVKNSYELEVLDCHKALLKGGKSTVTNQRVNKKSFWFSIRSILQ